MREGERILGKDEKGKKGSWAKILGKDEGEKKGSWERTKGGKIGSWVMMREKERILGHHEEG